MTKVLALDLSLSATGLFYGDPTDPTAPSHRDEITTPDRREGESDVAWNARRFDHFSGKLLGHLERLKPDLLVLEVTSHAHTTFTVRGQTRETSRGQEFRAGLGLGRALGWIDGVLVLAAAYGTCPPQVATIEANDAKLRVAGNKTASKTAVRNKLAEAFAWRTDGWRESQVDALAAGLGWLRQAEQLDRERAIRQLASAQSARPRPARGGRGSGARAPRPRRTRAAPTG